jgi:hypothetical protein
MIQYKSNTRDESSRNVLEEWEANGIGYARGLENLTMMNIKILIVMMEVTVFPETLVTLTLHRVASDPKKIHNHCRQVDDDRGSARYAAYAAREVLASLFQRLNCCAILQLVMQLGVTNQRSGKVCNLSGGGV